MTGWWQIKRRLLDWCDAQWERITARIPRLSRPWRVVRNLVCILLSVCLFWLLMGGEALTPEWAFRRAERQMRVGPSEILGTFEVATDRDYPDRTERYIVGETEGELLVCQIFGSWSSGYSARLSVWEKSETMTLALLADGGIPFPDDGKIVYFLGYTELPWAVRAELDLTAQDEEEDETEQWHVTAELENGCFVFPFENFYWRYTEALSGDWSSGVVETAYTLRLYDSQGKLLAERSWSYAQERRAVEERARRQEGLARY